MSELPGKVRSSAPLNLRQIEVFHAIMITGSLSAAGRLLHVTQPAISRVLASIELRLGYALFERFKGRLHPTKEARKLFQEVESIQAGVNRLNDMAAGLAGHGGGLVSVVTVGKTLRDAHGADVLIMGCAGMADLRARLEAACGLPVVEPTQAAVAMAVGRIFGRA